MTHWIICPDCRGDGKHSKHIGAITEEDRDREWDDEEFDAYLEGAYDMTCGPCRGTGKVRTQGSVCPACGNTDHESMSESIDGVLTCLALIEEEWNCHEMWHPDDACKEARDREWKEPPSYRYEY